MVEFYNIPLTINPDGARIFDVDKGNPEQSIDSILDLIVFTPKGRFTADPEFGFEYWNHEFSNINIREFNNNYLGVLSGDQLTNTISRHECEQSLKDSITAYVPTLRHPDAIIELEANTVHNKFSKYIMRIIVTGMIDDGMGLNKPYEKKISFLVEPTVRKLSI